MPISPTPPNLVRGRTWWFAADVYKAYLVCACRVIRQNGGDITAFDGDRVMAIYIGDGRDPAAVRSAMQINYVTKNIITPKITQIFTAANDTPYEVKQSVGIDRSVLYAVRTGIRGYNDLVWVGMAANVAAKMCTIRDGYDPHHPRGAPEPRRLDYLQGQPAATHVVRLPLVRTRHLHPSLHLLVGPMTNSPDVRSKMGIINDLTTEVTQSWRPAGNLATAAWSPRPEDVKLGNDAVKLDGTVLYADLADSTGLVKQKSAAYAAEVYKSYLHCASKIIKHYDGVITAFDGDRVMAVYIGDRKNSNAVQSSLAINHAVLKIINPKIEAQYPGKGYTVRQSVGIDTGPLFVAKTGICGSNDLVWVGTAANLAAKLCALSASRTMRRGSPRRSITACATT